VHDEYSHGADAWRYLAINADKMQNSDERPPVAVEWQSLDSEIGY